MLPSPSHDQHCCDSFAQSAPRIRGARQSGFRIAPRPTEVSRKGRLVEVSQIQRGEIWWADLPEPRRSEPGYRRPVLVVQADSFNLSRIQTAIVAAITSNVELADAPGNVLLPVRSAGLASDSVVNVSQLLTLDRSFPTEHAGTLPLRL
jgi:mRNA interferase MazF